MEGYPLLAKSKIDSGFVGLLWFTEDNKALSEVDGVVEFSNSDFVRKVSIDPIGMHDKYKTNPYSFNRGKVSLVNGKLEMMVGQNCTEEAIEGAKKYMGLSRFPVSVIRTGLYDK